MESGAAAGAAERSAVYWLLADLFLTCPDVGRVHRISRDLQGAAGWGRFSAAPMCRLAALLPHDEEGVGGLAVEYTRLFGAVSRDGPPPPYESVHRPGGAPDDALAVAAAYAEAGLAVSEPSAPPDHLGVELRFMAMLCHTERGHWEAGEVEAARAARATERAFFDDHLAAWAPSYLDAIAQQARARFYAVLCTVTREVLAAERTALTP